ncbi:MAG: DNA-processing protein DprA [Sphaerochaetaceae bacterium]|nr:DNA-processing protein DprA [Sphaerochaetaceae bacterium]
MPDNEVYWVWLNELRGISIATKRTLLTELGSPKEVFDASPSQVCDLLSTYPSSLRRTYQTSQSLSELWAGRSIKEAQQIVTVHEKHEIRSLVANDNLHQFQFARAPRSPLVLYYRGSLSFSEKPVTGVIGTFPVSSYGRTVTREAVQHLIETGHIIASGLSEGTDALVHETALSLHAPTYAFLPGGLHKAYPAGHASLMERIAEAGAVISPFPYGKEALPFRFIRRNEIFALWCDSLLVIETSLTSGTMSTARYAMANRKRVLAVPGSLLESGSSGTNLLLSEGAEVYLSEPSLNSSFPSPATERVIECIQEHPRTTGELSQILDVELESIMESLAAAEADNRVEYRVDGRWHLVGGE